MMFGPPKSYLSNSSKDFLSDINVSIIQPKNLAGLKWMEGIKNVKSNGSLGHETDKGEMFIDFPLMITMFF